MLDTYKLKVFSTAVEKGSFTEAAKVLGVSQPAVSQNISDLEKQLGITLLVRNRSEFHPTEAGKELLDYTGRILYWCECAEKHFLSPGSDDEGKISILPIEDGLDAEICVEEGSLRIRMKKK